MIILYLLKIALLLPLLGALAFGLLWSWRKVETRMPGVAAADKLAVVREATMLAPGTRLAVVRFDGRDVLLAMTRGGVTLLAQGEPNGSGHDA